MDSLKSILCAGALAVGAIVPAKAADYLPRAPIMEEPATAVTELGTGWYLRGDLSYVDRIAPKDQDASSSKPRLRNMEIDGTPSFGGGVGYKFNNWFRADVTADFRSHSNFSNRSSGSFDRTGVEEGYNVEKGRFESKLVLANAYFDLGSWYGFTPYVGAGVGAAERGFNQFYTETFCVQESTSDKGFSACGSGVPNSYAVGSLGRVNRADHARWDFAWALMGGVSAQIGGGFSLDVGYRYVNLGHAETGYDVGITDPARTRLKDLEQHEVRVGLRYMID